MPKILDGCYYGERKAVYVQVRLPQHKKPGEQKHFVVYGGALEEVIRVVDRALCKAFGKTAAGRPGGRPVGRKEKRARKHQNATR